MRVPRMSAVSFRRLTIVNLVLLVAIIVSGAIVRLTNSGLGCRDWPNCSATQFVSVSTHHAAIEQINRLFSGAIGIPLALTVFAAYRLQPSASRDLVRLAWVLFGLFWCEAIVGGISVQVKLAWVSVMGHFLLALAARERRAADVPTRRRDRRPPIAGGSPGARQLVRVVYVWTIGVVILGTLVTAAGPHGGDREAKRLSIPIGDLARVHGVAVDALIALMLLTTIVLVRTRAPRLVINTASLTIAAMVAQGLLGYVQYARAIPAVARRLPRVRRRARVRGGAAAPARDHGTPWGVERGSDRRPHRRPLQNPDGQPCARLGGCRCISSTAPMSCSGSSSRRARATATPTASRSARPGPSSGSMLGMLEGGATHVGVATDHVIPSFRNDLWADYKTGEGIDPELFAQFQLLEDALEAMGVTVWPMVELEADDALASGAASRPTRASSR